MFLERQIQFTFYYRKTESYIFYFFLIQTMCIEAWDYWSARQEKVLLNSKKQE